MKTTKRKRTFTDEFKLQAVALLLANGGKLSVVVRQLDIAPVILRSWRDRGRGELQQGRAVQLLTLQALPAPAALCSPANSNGEVATLRSVVARLEMQNQILKLVPALVFYFARLYV